MIRAELKRFIEEELIGPEMEIFQSKGEEYTAGKAETEDALFNFHAVAEIVGITPTQVALVFFFKHALSIANYAKSNGQTPSGEPIMGRVHDGRNYLGFIGALIRELEELEAADEESPAVRTEKVGDYTYTYYADGDPQTIQPTLFDQDIDEDGYRIGG